MYVELHARSAFSFLEGASLPEDLVARAKELGLEAVALLDRDGVYGAPRFYAAAQKSGLRAHVGAEITSTEGFRYPLLVASRTGYQNLCRLITRMKMRAPKGEGAVTEDDLAEHAEGLICLTGGEEGPCGGARDSGFVARGSGFGIRGSGNRKLEIADHKSAELGIADHESKEFEIAGHKFELFERRTSNTEHRIPNPGSRVPNPESRVKRLIEIFGRENVYVELQRHFDRREEARNQAAVQVARELKLPLVATNGVSFSTSAERQVADVFTALRHHRTLETAGRLLTSNAERHLKPPEEMARLFADLPEAFANTLELSSRLEFTLRDLGYKFPPYPVPEGETQVSFLRRCTAEGAIGRYGHGNERAAKQLERELALIEKLHLEGYFLIVWDIVRYCREQGILVQGRGSAANSAVCYALGITAVDPVKMDLLFERFLSEERGEWPDIDLDLPSGDQRERAIQYVYERYGQRGAAMTANVITYRGRSAAREVGKVLGFDAETLGRLTSLVSAWEYRDASDTLERHFRDAGFDLKQPRIRKFLDLTVAIQDLPRHLGQHSGGLVVCQGQLDAVVPLEPATMPGRVVVQWDKDDCADLGIVKVDLLGLGMMAVLEDSIRLIRDHYGKEVDLAHLPPDDPEVYTALQKADTVGLFQVESRAQMSCLPRLCPKRFYDLVVEVAIIRPGPIVGNMVHPYLNRRLGREQVTYPHPSLEPVLGRTLGVPLFQEQLLRMAMIAAGFTGGEAEDLRRAMGFKRSEKRMQEIEKKLRLGMERQGIAPTAQEEIVHSITAFALYGFPESHAASFALLAYASAYLKCHYLAAFTAAMLNNQPMGFYHPSTLIKDAERHGLHVKPIDAARSEWPCIIERAGNQLAVRIGLRYVKGLREEAAQAMVRERGRAPFASLDDLVRRVPELRKDELVTLAEVGALNFIGESDFVGELEKATDAVSQARRAIQHRHRRDALWQVERAARPAGPLLEQIENRKSKFETRNSKLEIRNSDSDSTPEASSSIFEFPVSIFESPVSNFENRSPLSAMTPEERLVADFHNTGLTVGPHPMAYRRAELDALRVKPASALARITNGRHVRVAGAAIVRQRPGTAKGFVFLSLEDETGIANVIVTPDLFEQYRVVVVREPFLLIEGRLQNQDGVISVKAERIGPLTVSRAGIASHDFH
ncbi:MAG TPA: error-prone DNA polymerase [Terriglobia bacterium]|nr:error-prone DNA polymerase [Terriglobia bacterium]